MKTNEKRNIRWQLVFYDFLILAIVDLCMLCLYKPKVPFSLVGTVVQIALSIGCIMTARLLTKVYTQLWRYGGVHCYLELLLVDFCGFLAYLILGMCPLLAEPITFTHLVCISTMSFIGSLLLRFLYRYAYKSRHADTKLTRTLIKLIGILLGSKFTEGWIDESDKKKVRIAIVGAGEVGTALAADLQANKDAEYTVCCFVDIDPNKVERRLQGYRVFMENEEIFDHLKTMEVEEVVFAIHGLNGEHRKELFNRYTGAGYPIRVYDFPLIPTDEKKRRMREFDIEELLFREPIQINQDEMHKYYKGKVILITGGGGSIGSEICRQLAKMEPKQIVILDIYENGAYDVQQELKLVYKNLNLVVEISSITNYDAMKRIFVTYKPDIVINAAAHKHVPLMEHNCVEAVENNIFGCVNLVSLCEEFHTGRFMMVSTDKAVNPTNVMGATKRMCEMIVQSAHLRSNVTGVKYSATRFGNVLGSAGSVIPLFKRQIANGGPITLTDFEITRYFMTIPEASQLVLQSGVMAKNGELFVLDMGSPVKIYDLAQNMLKLSGVKNIEIIQTGLRPGEKLYEELLVKTEELDKTENKLIFIERDAALSKDEIDEKLRLLREACATGDDLLVKATLKKVVPTFLDPEEVNKKVHTEEEQSQQASERQLENV